MISNPRENVCWLSHCQSLHGKVAADLFQNNGSTYILPAAVAVELWITSPSILN